MPFPTAVGLTFGHSLRETASSSRLEGFQEEGAELARSRGFDAEPVAEQGDPVWQRIISYAEERDAGIVVMGSHPRTGIGLVLLGSVAAATTRHTDLPVLIAH